MVFALFILDPDGETWIIKKTEEIAMADAKEDMIRDLCEMEWTLFDRVRNEGGRASCQNDPAFFKKMRACQFVSWSEPLLRSYKRDLEGAVREGRNPLTEKYAFMMEKTHPQEFEKIRDSLPKVSAEALGLIAAISKIQMAWEREVDLAYPHVRAGGRPLTSDLDTPWQTSFETYLGGELRTYSVETLRLYADYAEECREAGRNLAKEVAEHTAVAYGYASLDDAERKAEKR